MENSIFNFSDYKNYLKKILSTKGLGRGSRSKLAQFLGCQTGHISQNLNGIYHFSFEHALSISDFLSHTNEEKQFFLLLVSYARAGTEHLKKYYQNEMQEIKKKRSIIKERIKVDKELSYKNQMIYYSSWYYLAIHFLLSVPDYQTKESIAKKLNLPLKKVSECLDFLILNGMAKEDNGRYQMLECRNHLNQDSPTIKKHHTNWNMEAIRSLERDDPLNLHYSGAIALSFDNARKIREFILKLIETMEPIIRESGEEDLYALSLDFFSYT